MKQNKRYFRRVLFGIGIALMLAVFIYAASQIISYLRPENENRALSEDLIDKAVQITPPGQPKLLPKPHRKHIHRRLHRLK